MLLLLLLFNFLYTGEANIGMFFSPCKSVGKSLSAKVLAYAQGVPRQTHPQLLAGGDQISSGTSVYAIIYSFLVSSCTKVKGSSTIIAIYFRH